MSERVLEAAFRHKVVLLFALMLGLAAGIGYVAMTYDSYYASRATIWVDRPSAVTGAGYIETNPYNTPAQNQANGMQELLATQAFIDDVLSRIGSPEPTDAERRDLRANTSIWPFGTHILYVQFRAKNAEEAAKSVEALLEAYGAIYTSQIQAKATQASEFYREQLDAATTALETAETELRAYMVGKPQFNGINLLDPPASALSDLTFARLSITQQVARSNYNNTLESYTQGRVAETTASSTSAAFNVTDKPEVPSEKTTPAKRAIVMHLLTGLMPGLALTGVLLFAFVYLDRSIRSTKELEKIAPEVALVSLPTLKIQRRSWPASFVRIGSALRGGFKLEQEAQPWPPLGSSLDSGS